MLEEQKFSGRIRVESFVGDFCLVGNPNEGFQLADAGAAASKCDLVGNPFDDSLSNAQRQSVDFANFMATLRRRTDGDIQVEVVNAGRRHPWPIRSRTKRPRPAPGTSSLRRTTASSSTSSPLHDRGPAAALRCHGVHRRADRARRRARRAARRYWPAATRPPWRRWPASCPASIGSPRSMIPPRWIACCRASGWSCIARDRSRRPRPRWSPPACASAAITSTSPARSTCWKRCTRSTRTRARGRGAVPRRGVRRRADRLPRGAAAPGLARRDIPRARLRVAGTSQPGHAQDQCREPVEGRPDPQRGPRHRSRPRLPRP